MPGDQYIQRQGSRCRPGMSAISINDLATLFRFPILLQAMIRILAMLLLLLVAPGARTEAKDCYRKAVGTLLQASLAQAGRQRVTNDEK